MMSKNASIQTRQRVSPSHLFVVGLVGIVAACASTGSEGGSEGRYRFDVIDQPVPASAHSTFTVRLTDMTLRQPVEGASISDVRLTMRMQSIVSPGKGIWPDRTHSGDVRFVGSSRAGQYRFVGDVSMPGTWTLHVTASVPGEASPAEGYARFRASRIRQHP